MYLEQMYTGCLAEAAYYIESAGEAIIIDPLRETAPYLEKANERGATIKYILETHFHADFVSGHIDLARETGATIVYGPKANPSYAVHEATDGEELTVGAIRIRVLHTPGHTPESTTYLLLDEDGNEHAIFTGDTLFIGDVGRPDLAIKGDVTKEDLAGMLYDSLRNKIMPLPDHVLVYPAHGAGSACGKNMSSETFSTLGEQKRSNYALQDISRAAFIQQLTTGIMPPPQYFPKNAMLNKTGYGNIEGVLKASENALSVEQVLEQQQAGALILDTRNEVDFAHAHIPDSLFIGLDGSFAVWAGSLITNLQQPLVLITEAGREEEAVKRLARVGYDNTVGYLNGGVDAWLAADQTTDSIQSVPAEEFASMYSEKLNILDVRKPGEYENCHVSSAQSFPLDFIRDQWKNLDPNQAYHIHCLGGYRSIIASSILRQHGFHNITNIGGGFEAMKQTKLPILIAENNAS